MTREYRFTYADASGEVHDAVHPMRLRHTDISTLVPIRSPNNYRGQTHISGLHFSPNTGRLHPFESRLEQVALIRADHELAPNAIATQPFALLYHHDGKDHTHIPDILLEGPNQPPLVIDVKPKVFVEQNAVPFGAMREACAAAGWTYAIWTEPSPAYAQNLSFLAGYHRPVHESACERILHALHEGPVPIQDLLADVRGTEIPALFHLLWWRKLHADLTRPMTGQTLIHLPAAG